MAKPASPTLIEKVSNPLNNPEEKQNDHRLSREDSAPEALLGTNGPDKHLQLEDIEHRTRKTEKPRSTGFIEPFHRTLLEEHLRSLQGRDAARANPRTLSQEGGEESSVRP